ncbi:MAG: hypothetical protein V1871_04965 [Planctomycetota bacterium]
MTNETIILGKEYDDKLRDAVRATMREFGGKIIDKTWGVGGSQEVERVKSIVEGKTVVIEAETYIGLSINGDSILVQRIAARVRERMAVG